VEFALSLDAEKKVESWGVENPEALGLWVGETEKSLRALGEKLAVGELILFTGRGIQNHVALSLGDKQQLCVGFGRSLDNEEVGDTMKQIQSKWAS